MEMTGCGTAIVTPFKADGSLDEPAMSSLVNWQIESGIDFLVACGSTGEAATLDEDEWLQTVRLVIDSAAGRVPVWAGCTHNSTRVVVRQAAQLRRVPGLAAVLSANPYYNKPTQEGQFQHFLALAREVDPLPVCVYNVPGRTAANLEPETVARLAAAASNIQAIKEASGKLTQFAELSQIAAARVQDFFRRRQPGAGGNCRRSARADQRGVERSSGRGDTHDSRGARQQLGRGAGAGAALRAAVRGQFWESNPAPVKTVLSMMGRCTDQLRLPLVPPTAATRAKLERLAGETGAAEARACAGRRSVRRSLTAAKSQASRTQCAIIAGSA